MTDEGEVDRRREERQRSQTEDEADQEKDQDNVDEETMLFSEFD